MSLLFSPQPAQAPSPDTSASLFVSPRFLFPIDQGGKVRTCGILRGLKGKRFEIVLAAPAPAGAAAHAAAIAAVCDRFLCWPEPPVSSLRRVAALAGRLPVSVAADLSPAGRTVVAAALAARPDLVVFDFPHAAVLAPAPFEPPSVLFTHNVEAEILDRHAALARGPMQGPWRWLWRRQARLMDRFEREVLHRFDTVIAVSPRDAGALRRRYGLAAVEVIDTGVDLDACAFSPPGPGPDAEGGTVVFRGAMDSRSNIEGVAFLMDEVWPHVARARPAARALIVGRNPPAALLAQARRRGLPWHFTGTVDDIRPHVRQGDVSVIPLRVGSGTRLKAFEAMALGVPMISTTLGVEGLPVTPGEHLLVADTAEAFAAAVLRLLADAALRSRLAGAARALLELRFSWAHVAAQFEAVCQQTLIRAGDGAAV